jgi:hypothetical protein
VEEKMEVPGAIAQTCVALAAMIADIKRDEEHSPTLSELQFKRDAQTDTEDDATTVNEETRRTQPLKCPRAT